MNNKWVSFSPHILSKNSTTKTYLLLIVLLCPVLASAVVVTSVNALWVVFSTITTAVVTDIIFKLIVNKKYNFGELSAIYIGLIIGLALPTGINPFYAIIGTMFTMIFIRNISGGIGQNFVSEIAVAVVLTSLIFAPTFNSFIVPTTNKIVTSSFISNLKYGKILSFDIVDLLFGGYAGSIAETACFWLLLAGVGLMLFKVIDFRIPVAVLASTFLFGLLFFDFISAVSIILAGGVVLSAFFIAPDYAVAPKTKWAKYLYGIMIGLLTVVILKYFKNMLAVYYAVIFVGLLSSSVHGLIYDRRRVN